MTEGSPATVSKTVSAGRIELGHSPELDGLRGVAIALVLIYHYVVAITPASPDSPTWWLIRALSPTWSGVDLFFVLSGYLIGGILEENRTASNFLRVFYWRRACRILPAYALNLVAAVLIPLLFVDFFRGTTLDAGSFPVWSYFLFVQNLVMAARDAWSSWPLTWSLAVEEQFYFFLPPLFLLARTRLVPILLTLGLAAPVLRHFLPSQIAAYVLPISRADSLFLGVLLALLVRRNPTVAFRLGSSRILVPVLAACSVGIGLIQPWWRLEPMRSAGMFVLALTYGALLIKSQVGREGVLGHTLRNTRLMWLGRRSYFIYLAHTTALIAVHWLIRGHSARNDGALGFAVTLAAFGLTLLAAEISWRLIEAPAIRAGHRQVFKHN